MVNLPENIFSLYEEFADDFINDNFGVDCTIFYPVKKTPCSNCQTPDGGGSSNVFIGNSPAPFNFGTCSVCGGDGYKEVEPTDSIKLRVYYDRKNFVKINHIDVPDGTIQVIGFQSDLPKFLRANEILPNKHRDGYGMPRYKRTTNWYPHGFKQRRYFVSYLELV